MAVDPDALATDVRFPDEHSHAKHAALLLLDALEATRPDPAPVPMSRLVERVTVLLERFPAWAKAYQSDGGAARLTAEAVELLRAFGLADRERDLVRALPAAARYRPPAVDELRLDATAELVRSTSSPTPGARS